MSRQASILCFSLTLFLLQCREPFDGFDHIGRGTKLVIEGIVTDSGEHSYIRLSYSESIDGAKAVDYETEDGAQVMIEDDLGNEFVYLSQGDGLYEHGSFRAVFGRSYRLNVQVGNNAYRSTWEKLSLEQSPALEVSYSPGTIQVLNEFGNIVNQYVVTINDQLEKQEEEVFYYWQLYYYYQYDAYGQPDIQRFLPSAKRFCFVSEPGQPGLEIHHDRSVSGLAGTTYSRELTYIPFGTKMIYDYSVEVVRYNTSKQVFAYLEQVERQTTNSGGVFDASPSSLQGNLKRVSGELEMLGFFGVFNVTSDRLFFNQYELPFDKLVLPTDAVSCPGHHNISLNNACFNCTAVPAVFNSHIKPSWWR